MKALVKMAAVIQILVTFGLDYCSVLSVELPLKTVQKPQLVQRAAAHPGTAAPSILGKH